ncbi:restriction endonuclease subunit S [Staphylococcus sp. Marseille-Q1834]|uniref:restriction endonuclease subunit S n=1 Tax=Staphylococcus sp. Marseille-Q1834 TaxID=2866594 RepID=UPI001CF8E305|nr:restriction endonuclease subunit S [Staphylococcus sp. Marseille-Q1834]
MSKHRNTPELRFPEFKDEWKNNELGKLLSIISGHSPSYYSEGSEYPLYKVNDLNNNSKFQDYSDLYVEKKHTPLNKKVIIFPKRGAAILLNKIRIINTPGYIDTNLMGLEFNDVNDTEFYYYAILREGLYRIADTSTIPQINNKHILPYKIYSPSYIEKNKLGNFFSKLDRQIELEEEKLELLEQQKKGYMQKIFSQELRFKDENGKDYPAWEIKKLGDLYKYQQGQQIPVENQYKIPINNMKRFIRIVDITENPKKRYIKDRKESGLINQKDLIMIRYGASAGTISMGYEGVIANNLFKFVKKQNVDNRYFYFLLKKSHFKIKSLSSQSAMPALNFNAMNTLKFSIPQYSEQQKIGDFFSELDKLVEKQVSKIELLKQRKQGLLQKMFV